MIYPTDYKNESLWRGKTYLEIISAAVADFIEYGFDSSERVEVWSRRIRESAKRSMIPEGKLQSQLKRSLTTDYNKLVTKGGLLKRHQGVPRFTIDKIKPELRAELDRRIMASASLIKINRDRAVEHTLQRFTGWATSVPVDGVPAEKRQEIKTNIAKSIKQLPFEERRVIIDQGHKLTSAINNIVATSGGAIAAMWHSHWREINYNYRKQHKARDQKVYALKGNWAIQKGLMNKGDGYYEDMDAVGQEPFCRCYVTYIYHLRDLPKDMLTDKGKQTLAEIRKQLEK